MLYTSARAAPLVASRGRGGRVLLELSVVVQRYDAVMGVIRDGREIAHSTGRLSTRRVSLKCSEPSQTWVFHAVFIFVTTKVASRSSPAPEKCTPSGFRINSSCPDGPARYAL